MAYQKVQKSSLRSPQTPREDTFLATRPFSVQTQPNPIASEGQQRIEKIPSTAQWLAEHPLMRKIAVDDSVSGSSDLQKSQFESRGIESTETSTEVGHIQRLCDACEKENSEEQKQPLIQTKLTLGQPGDKYEQQADAIARQVVDRIHAPQMQTPVQRQSNEGKAPELNITIMRQSNIGIGDRTSPVEQGIQQARGRGHSLPETVREPMEQAFGADFSGVKIHTDTQSDRLNRSLNARAFTTGSDIFFKQGEYNPGTKQGQELMAHELTHVIQQTGDRTQIQRWSLFDSIVEGIQNIWDTFKKVYITEKIKTVTDPKALIRDPENNWKSTGTIIPQGEQVEILEALSDEKDSKPKYVLVQAISGGTDSKTKVWGWTKASNLGSIKTPEDITESDDPSHSEETDPDITQPEEPTNQNTVKPEDITDTQTFELGKSNKTAGILDSSKEALEKVNETPESWFSNFTDTTFLGRKINRPIHRILAAHLKNVETNFVSKTGAKSPKEAGDKYGLSNIPFAGGRASEKEIKQKDGSTTIKESAGMHVFGLAIDIDVRENPWIAMPNKKDKTEGGGEEKWSNMYYGRMQELLGGERLEFKRDFHLGKHNGVSFDDRLTATIENMMKLDKMVESYFSLLEPENEPTLKELLSKANTPLWKGLTAEEARKQIQEDLIQCGKIWRRTDAKEIEAIRKGGITNFSEEFIRGMDLYWGGMFGDNMHFDMRDRGVGAKIYKLARES